jgi:hypothetical protein
MDVTITGTIKSRPRTASADVNEKQISFPLFRDKEWDEVACVSSLRFDGGVVKLGPGDKVTLLGEWVGGNSKGDAAIFLFEKAEVLKAGTRGLGAGPYGQPPSKC